MSIGDLSGIEEARRHAEAGDRAALVRLARDSQNRIARQEAATRLGDFPPDEVEAPLADLLRDDEHPTVRIEAARALAKAGGGERTTAALVAGLSDPHDDVAMWSAEGLGRLRRREAVEPLAAMLADPSEWKRVYATQALGRIRHRSAVPALLRALEDDRRRVFSEAADSLAGIADDRDLEALAAIRRTLPWLRRRRVRKLEGRIRAEHAGGP